MKHRLFVLLATITALIASAAPAMATGVIGGRPPQPGSSSPVPKRWVIPPGSQVRSINCPGWKPPKGLSYSSPDTKKPPTRNGQGFSRSALKWERAPCHFL